MVDAITERKLCPSCWGELTEVDESAGACTQCNTPVKFKSVASTLRKILKGQS